MKPGATPKFYRPRPIPLAMKTKIEEDLDRMEKLGIIEKVDTSEWAAPTVPVVKADGSVRHCGDYKVMVNPHLDVNQHPLPRPDELFTTLNGGQLLQSWIYQRHIFRLSLMTSRNSSLSLTLTRVCIVLTGCHMGWHQHQQFFRKLWIKCYRVCQTCLLYR